MKSVPPRFRPVLRGLAWLSLIALLSFWILLLSRCVLAYSGGGWTAAVEYLRENARAYEPRLPSWPVVAFRYSLMGAVTALAWMCVRVCRPRHRRHANDSVQG